MEKDWEEVWYIFMDMLVGLVVLGILMSVLMLGNFMARQLDKNRVETNNVNAYRVARMYEDSDCYSQDIISLILEYQGNPEVIVTTKNGNVMSWNRKSLYTQITAKDIGYVLNQSSTYKCTLKYDSNGSLESYQFKEE